MKAPVEQSSYNFLVLIYYDMYARSDVIMQHSLVLNIAGIAIIIDGYKRAQDRM